jgi:hypothetical protein
MIPKNGRHVLRVSVIIVVILSLILTNVLIFENKHVDHQGEDQDVEYNKNLEGIQSETNLNINPPLTNRNYFTENQGQWDNNIRFIARTSFGTAALENDGISYNVIKEGGGHVIKITFLNSLSTSPSGISPCGFGSNYFLGNDPEKWVTEARSFQRVEYENVWPGIDLEYYFKDGELKYDILVGEYADCHDIMFEVEGHKDLEIEDEDLKIILSDDLVITDSNLVAFYDDKDNIPISFKEIGKDIFGFDVNKTYGGALTIDPIVFTNSTYLGGTGGDNVKDVVLDTNDNIIIAGSTMSSDFPEVTGGYQDKNEGGGDVLVSKMHRDTGGLIFATYIGNWSGDWAEGVDVDTAGNIYVTGTTWSWYYPTTIDAFQPIDPSMSYPDAFVTKLNPMGNDLVYSTYVGGTQSDGAYDIDVVNGKAYVSGNALSYDFPSAGNPVNNAHGTVVLFVMNEDGSNMTHTAFFGGFGNEFGYAIGVDSNGDVVIGGQTSSTDFPTTPGALQTSVTDLSNGFLIKYNITTNSTIFSTYLGGDVADVVRDIRIDSGNNIYVMGTTAEPGDGQVAYPTTPGAFDREVNGGRDLFISKINPNGDAFIFSTYFGSHGDEESGMISLDSSNNVLITGAVDTFEGFPITPDCYDDTYNLEGDAFVSILSNDGAQVKYSTLLGGNQSDSGIASVVDGDGDLIIVGNTQSADFPVTGGSFQTEYNGGGDIFVTRFKVGNYLKLEKGWNFISIPLKQSITVLENVLFSISGYYDAVQWYKANDAQDHWKHNHYLKFPLLNDLNNIDHKMSFWVHITRTEGVILEYSGTIPPADENIWLYQGWNMIGYPSASIYDRTAGLNKLVFGFDVDCIQWYDATTESWHSMGPDDNFIPGRGYWIHSKVDKDWEVPL